MSFRLKDGAFMFSFKGIVAFAMNRHTEIVGSVDFANAGIIDSWQGR